MASVVLRPAGATSGLAASLAVITMPRIGVWHATLHLASEVKPKGRVEIQAGPLALSGTVDRVGLEAGGVRVRVVAGAGRLGNAAKPRHYTSPVVRMPLDDLARDAGESLSPTCDAAVMNRTLLAWTTLGTLVLTDLYVMLVASGTISDLRFVG